MSFSENRFPLFRDMRWSAIAKTVTAVTAIPPMEEDGVQAVADSSSRDGRNAGFSSCAGGVVFAGLLA
jgi:hypothetical protein